MAQPHGADVWDARETWSRDRLAAHQAERLRVQLAHVAHNSAYYRRLFHEAGFEAGDAGTPEALRHLPVTRKADFAASVEAAPPWGDFAAVAPERINRVHFSSGTTGRPTPNGWTAADLERWTDLYARMAYSQGVRPGDVFQCLFTLSWFVGGLGALAAYQRLGATCIPAGSGDSERQIRTMLDFATTAVCATPSFMAHLAEVAERLGVDPRATALRRIMLGGEPGAGVPATRARIEGLWGAKACDGYGSLEFQPIGWECEAQAGAHLAEDFAYAEILDPESEQPVPDGTPGVLVLTHLDKEAFPLVRWWTGDVVVRDSAPCACGRTHARLPGGVRGRADDMLVIRGVNVFPTAVEQVVRETPGTTGEYLIVLDDEVRDPATGFLSGLKLRVEGTADAPPDLGERLSRAVRERLQVRAQVRVEPPGSLPRSTHKARRVVREEAGA